jgi:hypothetical protein
MVKLRPWISWKHWLGFLILDDLAGQFSFMKMASAGVVCSVGGKMCSTSKLPDMWGRICDGYMGCV